MVKWSAADNWATGRKNGMIRMRGAAEREIIIMKYAIIGAGGTGGILGFYMTKAGKDVTLIARGRHLAAMQESGLALIAFREDGHLHTVTRVTTDISLDTPLILLNDAPYQGTVFTFGCLVEELQAQVTLGLRAFSHHQ